MKFRARTNSKLDLDINWLQVKAFLSKWKPGTLFEIKIDRYVPMEVSPSKRKQYFGYILKPYAEFLGYEPNEMDLIHHQLKSRYFEHDPDLNVYQDKLGIYRNVPSVFSNSPHVGFEKRVKFIDWVIRRAAWEGCDIPDAQEMLRNLHASKS